MSKLLIKAARNGNLSLVQSSLAKGVNPNCCHNGLEPLSCAAGSGHVQVIEALIKGGAGLDGVSSTTTPLMVACFNGQVESARILLKAGANINIRNVFDMTARDYAVDCANPESYVNSPSSVNVAYMIARSKEIVQLFDDYE